MVGKPTIRLKISKQMKRYGNLYEKVCDLDNLRLAYRKARKGKGNRYGVKLFDRDIEGNLLALQKELRDKTYKTSEYSVFTIYEPKEREISRLPFRDRVVHHAIMNILEPIWVGIFSRDTYSCIKKRGIHGAARAVKKDLARDPEGTIYCLKGDCKKYYPSVDHETMKQIVRRKIKDKDLLWLIDGIIDSAPGIPIGNYLSQYLANLYLAYFDHDIKILFGLRDNPKASEAYYRRYAEIRSGGKPYDEIPEEDREEALIAWRKILSEGIKHYYRYADDWVILHSDKAFLSLLLEFVGLYFGRELKLEIKKNWQIYPVEVRGIDFVGYVFRHTHIRMRKGIKRRFFRKVSRILKKDPNVTQKTLIHTVCSYYGWALYCNGRNLLRTIFNKLDNEIKLRLPKTVRIS